MHPSRLTSVREQALTFGRKTADWRNRENGVDAKCIQLAPKRNTQACHIYIMELFACFVSP